MVTRFLKYSRLSVKQIIMRRPFFILFLFLSTNLFLFSQVAIGKWRDHLSYNYGIFVVEVENKIYCATEGGALFYYNKSDNSIQKLSKANGLSDVGVSSIAYASNYKTLIVAYKNANIDLIIGNTIFNIPDIKNKNFAGSKSINKISIHNNKAYISCGFGIVLLNLERNEIAEQYIIGSGGSQIAVLDITFDNQYIYAATEKGIMKGALSGTNLIDFSNWSQVTDIPSYNSKFNAINNYNDRIFVNTVNTSGKDAVYYYENGVWNPFNANTYTDVYHINICHGKMILITDEKSEIYNSSLILERSSASYRTLDAIVDIDGGIWFADMYDGMVMEPTPGQQTKLRPNGPHSNTVYDISIENSNLWAAAGSPDNPGSYIGGYAFANENWRIIDYHTYPETSAIPNLNVVAVNPTDSSHVVYGTYGYGLVEFRNRKFSRILDETNTINPTIKPIPGYGHSFVRCNGVKFDMDGNLWFLTSSTNNPLYVLQNNGKLKTFDFNFTGFDINQRTQKLTITNDRDIWFLLTGNTRMGVFAFDDNGTIENTDDDQELFFEPKNQENKKFSDILSIATDKDGNVWLGTNEGPIVYYQPSNVFLDSENGTEGNQINIPRNDGSGLGDYLLATESISAIAIDGANRKWFGTISSGLYLVSEDGTKLIQHFTAENSPLISNYITTIAIDNKTGEVFIGTDKGILSYKGEATESFDDFKDVLVYPNPVREDYTGLIAIKGLVANTIVKITDVNGNLVYETRSLGGQATWDGKNFSGQRAATGVYLIFLASEDGSKTFMTKLLFIH